MVEAILNLEPEVQRIYDAIRNGKNFLLSGGAGSGKTYSLVQVIKEAIKQSPTARIACMTYTNAAVREIEQRVNHKNLKVSTIHDFLWDNIKFFQDEIRACLVELINDEAVTKIKSPDGIVQANYFDHLENGIQYTEWMKIKEGKISHEELLVLANYMFAKYPKLSDIIKDRYKYIFIDEYQDTHPEVVEIFLTHLKASKRNNIIGFFGDAMQSIYDDGVGDLKAYIQTGDVTEIKKEQNRRNPHLVIELANKLRSDGLTQAPSTDVNAPNMSNGKVIQGDIKFYYSTTDDDVLDSVRQKLKWDFRDIKETKELNLTHNLIAPKAGFPELMAIYDKDPVIGLKRDILERIKYNVENNKPPVDFSDDDTFDTVVDKFALRTRKAKGEAEARKKKDILLEVPEHRELYNKLKDLPFSEVRKIYLDKEALIDDKKHEAGDESKKGSKRDKLIKHLFKIQTNIKLYQEKKYNEFIRRTEYPITRVQDKRDLMDVIAKLEAMSNNTIEEVIDYAEEAGICFKDDNINNFIRENAYLYDRVKKVKFQEFQNLFDYLEGYTPFSTQHKIKGDEFDNVLVILNNGNWFDYNFEYLFENRTDKESVLKRTQKIFYVCCTRSKKNLAVFYSNPSESILAQARIWFGTENVVAV